MHQLTFEHILFSKLKLKILHLVLQRLATPQNDSQDESETCCKLTHVAGGD